MTRFSKFPEESRTEGERETFKQRINRLIAICLYGDVGNESTSAEGKNKDFIDTDDFINADDDDDDDNDGSNDGSGISDNGDDNIGADGHEPGPSHYRRRRRHRHHFFQLHWIQQPDLYEEFEFNPTSGNGLFQTSTNEQWLRERNYKKLFSPARHLVMSCLASFTIFSINFDSMNQLKGSSRNNGF